MLKEPVSSLVRNTHNKADVIYIITSICCLGTRKTALNKCFTYTNHLRKHGRVSGWADFADEVYFESCAQKRAGGCLDELRERLVGELDNYDWK